MSSPENEQKSADETPRWNRYYAAVLIHLTAWIVGLYAFSRYFGVAE